MKNMNLSALIPTNEVQDNSKELLVKKIVEDLKNRVDSWNYRPCNLVVAREICQAFVAKGYHAKINFFTDGRAEYQAFIISKKHLCGSGARLIFSEIIG